MSSTDSHHWLLLAEGVGSLATLALLWNQVRMVLGWFVGIVVVTKTNDINLQLILLSYLLHAGKKIATLGTSNYDSKQMWVRPLDGISRVVYRVLGRTRSVFLYKKHLIWNFGTNSATESGLSFFRGTVDWNAFLKDAMAYEKDLRESSESTTSRFRIKKIIGRGGLLTRTYESQPPTGSNTAPKTMKDLDTGFNLTNGWELIHYAWDEVGLPQSKRALDLMALTPEMNVMVEQIRFWLESKEWHEEKGIPWCLSYLWKGPPGTGKTTLARALGEVYDLPIFSYNLASLTDAEFVEAWDDMLSSVPCIAFLDDIDRTFNGDKNVAVPEGGLSYACLLQAMSGIERSHGLLTIATANHPEKLDSALAGQDLKPGEMPTRPGRIDEYITFGALDEAGRRKLANRIVGDGDLIEQVVAAGYRDTGAQFQLRCIQAARAVWLRGLRTKSTKRASP